MAEYKIYVVQIGGQQKIFGLLHDQRCYEWKFTDLFFACSFKEREDIELEKLNVLDRDIWFSSTNRTPTLRNIADEILRVHKSDTNFPAIIVDKFGLIDGTHRVVKAYIQGFKTLSCVKFTLDELFIIPHLEKDFPPQKM